MNLHTLTLSSSAPLLNLSLSLPFSISSSSSFLRFFPTLPLSPLHFTLIPALPSRASLINRDESEEEEEEYEDDDDDDDVVAEEYEDEVPVFEGENEVEGGGGGGRGGGGGEVKTWSGEPTWKTIERLRLQVAELGDGIIDLEELASIYDFPIDKFQQLAILAFLRGSSVVVSAPTSSGKTLIAEAAAVATIARGRRLFYTTPLKALSNQKYRDFWTIL